MIEHSEFPWGPQEVPGLLTPLGVVGWLVALALAVAVLALARNGGRGGRDRRKPPSHEIHKTYEQIRAAADHAMSLDNYSVLAGVQTLREVIQTRLGRVLDLGGDFAAHLKALAQALEEQPGHRHDCKDDGKRPPADHGAPALKDAALTAVGNTVHGPSITVNVGLAERPEAPAPEPVREAPHVHAHHEHRHDDHEKPLTLEERLVLVRKRVGEFSAWWSHRAARIDQLEAALKDLTDPERLSPRVHSYIKSHLRDPFKEA